MTAQGCMQVGQAFIGGSSSNNSSYMVTGAGLGLLGGAAVGAIVVANMAGFPEVEIGEAAAAAMGTEGVAPWR